MNIGASYLLNECYIILYASFTRSVRGVIGKTFPWMPQMDENPYSSPTTESTFVARSRIWWFIVPSVIGVIVGANAMAGLFGTSPGDPFGSGRASGVGGFVGLIAGSILHRFIRPQPKLGKNGFPK